MIENKKYVIRKLTSYQDQDYFGITIPNKIAQQFSGTFFTVSACSDMIVLTSGCKHQQPIKLFEDIEK